MRRGFTLLEVMVAIVVFALVIAAAGGTFISVQQAWQRQKSTIELIQNARWAMELMANEIRQGTINDFPLVLNNDTVNFQRSAGVWVTYQRGGTVLYRNGVELANFVIDNPNPANRIFRRQADLIVIELTLSKEGKNYTLRTQVRPRN